MVGGMRVVIGVLGAIGVTVWVVIFGVEAFDDDHRFHVACRVKCRNPLCPAEDTIVFPAIAGEQATGDKHHDRNHHHQP